jgi:hypothetical protein
MMPTPQADSAGGAWKNSLLNLCLKVSVLNLQHELAAPAQAKKSIARLVDFHLAPGLCGFYNWYKTEIRLHQNLLTKRYGQMVWHRLSR